MQASSSAGSVSSGARRFTASGRAVSEDAVHRIALLAGLLLAPIVGLLWGHALTFSAVSRARRRLQSEGLIGLGELFAPRISRQQFEHGVWRGLWRVHGVSLAFLFVQLPGIALALLPAVLTAALLSPATMIFPPDIGPLLTTGLTALVGFFCGTVVAAQSWLALRLLAESGNRLSLGYVARVCGEAWRATLRELTTVLGIGLALAGALIAGAVVLLLTSLLASALKLGAGEAMVLLWTGAAVELFVLATTIDAVVAWADGAKTGDLDAKAFSFGGWLRAWCGSIVAWFAAKGLVTVGIAVCLIAGVLTALVAIATGENFTSWVGLGWFAVTAAVLVALSFKRGGKS